jgi:hypothetical protein
MAVVDTNSNPDFINYQIPGNDDSIKAIYLYMRVIGDALKGVKDNVSVAEHEKRYDEDSRKPTSKKASKGIKKERLPIKKEDDKVPAIKMNDEVIVTEENVPAKIEDKVLPAEAEDEVPVADEVEGEAPVVAE